jgi:hypothetical protein
MKSDFANELCQAFIEINMAKQVFHYCFDQDGNFIADEIDKVMAEHWPSIMDGTYGVCLKEISAKNVVLKDIAEKILKSWLNSPDQNNNDLYEKARYAAELYDNVASYFGPHELLQSSRNKLFNKFRAGSINEGGAEK